MQALHAAALEQVAELVRRADPGARWGVLRECPVPWLQALGEEALGAPSASWPRLVDAALREAQFLLELGRSWPAMGVRLGAASSLLLLTTGVLAGCAWWATGAALALGLAGAAEAAWRGRQAAAEARRVSAAIDSVVDALAGVPRLGSSTKAPSPRGVRSFRSQRR